MDRRLPVKQKTDRVLDSGVALTSNAGNANSSESNFRDLTTEMLSRIFIPAPAVCFPPLLLPALPAQKSDPQLRSHTRASDADCIGKGAINRVAVSPSGRLVAVAVSTGVYVYRLSECSGSPTEAWHGTTNTPVQSVVFSSDGQNLAAANRDLYGRGGVITIWNARSGEPIRDYAVPECHIEQLEYSTRGRKLLVKGFYFMGSSGPAVLDLGTGDVTEFVEDWQEDSSSIVSSCAAISPDGSMVAAAYDLPKFGPDLHEYYVAIFNSVTRNQIIRLNGFPGLITNLVFSPDGNQLVAGCDDGLVTIWDLSTGERKQTLFGFRRSVRQIAVSADGNTLAVIYEGGMISAWDCRDWFRLWVTDGRDSEVLTFSARDGSLISAGSRVPVFRWNSAGGELRNVHPCSEFFGVSTLGAGLEGYYFPVRRATRSRELMLQN